MEPRRPAHVLAEEVVVEDRHRGRPVVVCGPPRAPGATGAPLDDVVTDGGEELLSTFFRGFTTTRLDGDASEWPLPTPVDGLGWGVRDGWVGLSTDQSFLGGPERAEEVVDLVESVVDALLLAERSELGGG